MDDPTNDLDTAIIRDWRSIITLIVFVFANLVVLFPFHIPLYIPRSWWHVWLDTLARIRIIPPRQRSILQDGKYKRLNFPMGIITGPLIAVLFLLAILAIGRQEVHDGTVGADHIAPIDIMVFFLSLAYIAISIDASGLIRWLSFKVLQKGGGNGRRLFFYLYSFFFVLATAVGNDPIVLSGTPFLAYMTRASSNIESPRAWIYTQFSIANVASAILVSSNPTNLVLAGAFQVRFIDYTANMIVPVLITAILLFPFLLWGVFRSQKYVPSQIELHELPEDRKNRAPTNPNIPQPQNEGPLSPEEEEKQYLDSLEEVLNPYLDKKSAIFASVIMAAVLVSILVVNATAPAGKDYPVYWITLPAAVIVFCWDLVMGWSSRHETRRIVQERRARLEERNEEMQEKRASSDLPTTESPLAESDRGVVVRTEDSSTRGEVKSDSEDPENHSTSSPQEEITPNEDDLTKANAGEKVRPLENTSTKNGAPPSKAQAVTLQSVFYDTHRWLQETFPTIMTVVSHLPFPLIPFALCMFVLVQALVTKGWVPVFAYGWNHWVNATGTVGAIGGMGFLAVILCNFAGTNIGTTILLCRVIQAWVEIHTTNPYAEPISQRTFWATVYAMAIGVNYGAFSIAISGALAGMLWQSILQRKGIMVSRLEFWKVNVPIIAMTMVVGCAVLVGEVWVSRGTEAYAG